MSDGEERATVSRITVRGYQCDDESELLSTWHAALPYDPVDRRTFYRKVLLDPNFDPDWLLVAEVEGHVVGFCLCLIRRQPLAGLDLEPERGWITAMGVHPGWRGQGAGGELLEGALELLRDAGRRELLVSPYTPNYFTPGVDVDRYADFLKFLEKRQFEVVSRPMSMDASIVLFDHEEWAPRARELLEQGVHVRTMRLHEMPALLGLLKHHMPADWVRHGRELLLDIVAGVADEEQIIVAAQRREIVGYCQFDGEHFGPFGVRSDMQGRGIGSVLLAQCLATMRGKGLHNAWVLWTSDELAERVYARLGFRKTRRFAVLRRSL